MIRSYLLLGPMAALTLLVAGCSQEEGTSAGESTPDACVALPSGPPVRDRFPDRFSLRAEYTLPSEGPHTTLQLRSIDFRDGRFVGADSRTGTVKVFDSAFRPLMTLGRRGEGPGEFLAPFDAKFLVDGRIVVVDPELARMSVFGEDGEFQTSFPIFDQDPRQLAVGEDGRVYLAGLLGVSSSPHLVGEYDLESQERIASFFAAPREVFDINLIVDAAWVVTSGDDLFAGLAISQAIFHLSDLGSADCLDHGGIPGWQQLVVPESGVPTSLPGVRSWIDGASILHHISLSDGDWIRQFRTGPEMLLHIGGDSKNILLDQLPGRLIGVQGENYFFLRDVENGVIVSVWSKQW